MTNLKTGTSAKAILTILTAIFLIAPAAFAVDRFWQDGTDSYTNAGFWSTGIVPGVGDNAVNTNGAGNVVQINVGDPNWTLQDIQAGRSGGVGEFQQNDTNVNLNGWMRLGMAAGDLGTYTLSGGTLTFNNGGTLNVGELGTGILNINGGVLTINNGSQQGSRFNVAQQAGSTGTVNQTAGIVNALNTELWISVTNGAHGVYNLSGGTLVVSNWLAVGRGGDDGNLNITGGVLSNKLNNVSIGSFTSNRGSVTVSGSGLLYTTGGMWIGENGSNSTLVVTNGGHVTVLNGARVGSGTFAGVNTLLVSDPGSVFSNTIWLTTGEAGSGNSTIISNQGTVYLGDAGNMGWFATATGNSIKVTDTNSLLRIGARSFWGQASSSNNVTIANGGRVFIAAGGLSVGSLTTANGNSVLVTDPGSVLSNLNYLTIGEAGNGNSMIVSNGAKFYSAAGGAYLAGASNNNLVVTGTSGTSTSIFEVVGNVSFNIGSSNNATAKDGGVITAAGTINVNGTVNVDGGSVVSTRGSAPSLLVAQNAGKSGFIKMSGGKITTSSEFWLGNKVGSFPALTQNGGSISAGSYFVVGFQGDKAVYNLNGGTNTVTANILTIGAGSGTSTGIVTMTGGAINASAASGGMYVGENGYGVLNMSGGTITLANVGLRISSAANSTGIVNLVGGTIVANTVTKNGGAGTLNWNGGTLKASGGFTYTGINTYIYPGGAIFDDGGNTVTINSSLKAPSGNVVSSIAVTNGGSGYLDTPIVALTGGSGAGATAVAQIDYTAGNVTNVIVTGPGSGYGAGDVFSVSFFGGGGSGASATNSTTPAASGSFTKNGAGLLTLGGINTYTGGTILNGGTISIGNYDNLPAGSVTFNGGTLRLTSDSGFFYDGLNPYTINWSTFNGGIDIPSGWDVNNPLVITNNINAGSFTKSGAGVLVLNGTTVVSNMLTVSGGTLQYIGALSASNLTLSGGAIHIDTSLTLSNMTMTSGSTLALRADADTTFNAGGFTLANGTFNFQVNSINSPAGDGHTLTLNGQAGASVAADTTVNVSSTTGDTLKFGASSYHLSGNSGSAWGGNNNFFNLTGANVILSGMDDTAGNSDVILVLASTTTNSLTINGTVANNVARTIGAVVNSGILNLNNTVTDGGSGNHGFYVTVNAGTLNLNNNCINNNAAIGGTGNRAGLAIAGGNLGNTSGGAVTLFGNPTIGISADFTFVGTNDLNLGTGVVRLQNGTRQITVNQNTLTLGGAIGDAGATNGLIKAGAGTLSVRSGNTFLGNMVVNSGTLITDLTGATPGIVTPFGGGTVTISNATVRLGQNPGGNNNAVFYTTNSVSLDNASLIAEDANQHIAGTVAISSNGGTLGSTYNANNTSEKDKGLTLDGIVSGGGNLTLKHTAINQGNTYNTSFVAFTNNANTYSGTITVVPMTNFAGNAGGSFLGVNGSFALSNATINLLGNNPINATNFGSSPVVFLTGLGSATLGALSGTGSVVLTGYNETNHVYGGDSIALSAGGNNASTLFAGVISGGGSLTKAGSGSFTLTAINTYTGDTVVNSGTLLVNGSLAGGAVSVAGGATLGGTGTINGPVTVTGGLAPGASIGTLTVSNNLLLNASAALNFELAAPGSGDRVDVSSALTLDGTLNVSDAGGFTNGNYTLFNYGSLVDLGLNVAALPGGLSGSISNDTVSKKIVLVVTSGGGGDPYADWATAYGLSGGNALGTADPDGDGLINTNEFLAGFSPTNSAAYAHIISVTKSGSDLNITYLGSNGDTNYAGGPLTRTNVLEVTTGTVNGSFTNNFDTTGQTNILSGGTGVGVVTSFIETNGATFTPSRYYRVRVLVP